MAEGLAGETSSDNSPVLCLVAPISITGFSVSLGVFRLPLLWSLAFGVGNKVGNVTPELAVWPMLSEDGGWELFPLTENMSNWFIEYLF
jgi:hypothetical protein